MKPLAVLLAAGASTRMGRPKALLPLPDGRSLLQAWIHRLRPHCRVHVVTGAVELPLPPGVQERHNADWADTGMRESLLVGLSGQIAQRVLVTPVDLPPCSEAELRRLLQRRGPSVLGWKGQPGHPVLLSPAEVEGLRAGAGLRELLERAELVEADSDQVLLNLNTPEAWAAWLSRAPR